MDNQIFEPLPWYIAGPAIAITMFGLLRLGGRLGISSAFDTVCSMAGAGKFFPYFNFKWKEEMWNVVFISGTIAGGFISLRFFNSDHLVNISEKTITDLGNLGIIHSAHLLPVELFNWNNLLTPKGLILMVGGGICVGFGTRYAGGCTSGHAISGLADLQLPSLVAVLGFFAGGLLMSHFLLPLILNL